MEKTQALEILSALSQELRLDVVRLLISIGEEGATAGEISAIIGIRANTLSNNLSVLARVGLVQSRREGRSVRYFADIRRMGGLIRFLTEDCCGGHPELCGPFPDLSREPLEEGIMSDTYNVLFLCTGNSARSILAEAILNREGMGRFQGFSAGSQPKGAVHPFSLQLLERMNHDVSGLRSKSWDEFAQEGAPQMDFVFTVCDRAAAEECPYWPGQPMTAHWGLPDPAAVEGNEAERHLAFADTYRMLRNRLSVFVNLPLASLDKLALQKHLDEIGKSGAETPA